MLGTIGSGSGVIDESGAILTALKRSFYKGYVVMTAWAQRAAYGGDSPLPGDGAAPLSLWLTEYGIQISQDIATQCVGEIIDELQQCRR